MFSSSYIIPERIFCSSAALNRSQDLLSWGILVQFSASRLLVKLQALPPVLVALSPGSFRIMTVALSSCGQLHSTSTIIATGWALAFLHQELRSMHQGMPGSIWCTTRRVQTTWSLSVVNTMLMYVQLFTGMYKYAVYSGIVEPPFLRPP